MNNKKLIPAVLCVGFLTTISAMAGPILGFVAVPEPSTYIAGGLMLIPLAVSVIRKLRKP
jgi:hypothetical protein